MNKRRNIIIFVITFACVFSLHTLHSFADGEEKPRTFKVDAMYDRSATKGLPMRYPEEVRLTDGEKELIVRNGSIEESELLNVALSMLELGNPFMERYNAITGSEVQPLLEYGVPYFFGGRKMKNVLSKTPDYRTWEEWQDSKVYYKKGMRYFLGLDCKGFVDYVLDESGIGAYPIANRNGKESAKRIVIESKDNKLTVLREAVNSLQIGDVVSVFHPDQHTMIYIGTLRAYGYTEADFPKDGTIIDYPLVIHSGVNAAYADWFYHYKEIHQKYKRTSVPDGGVTVSIIGYSNAECISTITQQKQETSWILLPDDTWLTVIRWDAVDLWRVYR